MTRIEAWLGLIAIIINNDNNNNNNIIGPICVCVNMRGNIFLPRGTRPWKRA
jgi:hypothetical protein